MALHLHVTKAASASKTDPRNNPAVDLQLQHVRLVRYGAPPAGVPLCIHRQQSTAGAKRG